MMFGALTSCGLHLVLAGMAIAKQDWGLAATSLNVTLWSGVAAYLYSRNNT